MFRKIFSLSNGALFVALALSTIAAWYSIIGLTAIFAGAVVPIIIMGTALEFAKITTTVWLRKYWYRCSWVMKVYLVPAVVLLALLTSMGIFGFLSKAHLDQNIGSGDVQAQVALLDEKIAMQRETIKSSKAALAQMDMQVNDIMTKGDSEKSVERSVMIRKQQAKERASLLKDIEVANKEIQTLNEQRAPIASEMRKVEAEVGPIKYIAALIYGDNPDSNILERAVRWVIILLVVVFDPLAIMLVLAANQSKDWDENDDVEKENKLREQVEHEKVVETILEEAPVVEEPIVLEVTQEEEEAFQALEPKPEPEKSMAELHPYLNEPFKHFENLTPMVSSKPEEQEEILVYVADVGEKPTQEEVAAYEADEGPINQEVLEQLQERANEELPQGELITKTELFPEDPVVEETKIFTLGVDDIERPGDYVTPPAQDMIVVVKDKSPSFEGVKVGDEWIQTGPVFDKPPTVAVTPLSGTPFKKLAGGYVEFEGKRMHERVLRDTRPELFLKEDNPRDIGIDFGSTLPAVGNLGDVFINVDAIPHRVYKYNGTKWVEINKMVSSTYLSNTNYLQHLMDKISTGEYDPEFLTDFEQDAITAHINKA